MKNLSTHYIGQVCGGSTAPFALLDSHVHPAQALLPEPVHVLRVAQTLLEAAVQEGLLEIH